MQFSYVSGFLTTAKLLVEPGKEGGPKNTAVETTNKYESKGLCQIASKSAEILKDVIF
jgi:hypothetical protein